MKKKILVPVMAMAMLASGVVGGSLAYLTAETNTVTNVFTVGRVKIGLTETEATKGEDGNWSKTFQMMPGTMVEKDPTVTVDPISEKSWVFVKVTEKNNYNKDLVNETDNKNGNYLRYEVDTTTAGGWKYLGAITEDSANVSVYYRIQDKIEDNVPVKFNVLRTLKQDDENGKKYTVETYKNVNDLMMEAMENAPATRPELVFTAYAIQYEGGFEVTGTGDDAEKTAALKAWSEVGKTELATAQQ